VEHFQDSKKPSIKPIINFRSMSSPFACLTVVRILFKMMPPQLNPYLVAPTTAK